jgi:hypothetical protein
LGQAKVIVIKGCHPVTDESQHMVMSTCWASFFNCAPAPMSGSRNSDHSPFSIRGTRLPVTLGPDVSTSCAPAAAMVATRLADSCPRWRTPARRRPPRPRTRSLQCPTVPWSADVRAWAESHVSAAHKASVRVMPGCRAQSPPALCTDPLFVPCPLLPRGTHARVGGYSWTR